MAEVAKFYGEEAEDMLWELSGLLRGSLAVTLTYGFEERLFEVAEQRGGSSVCGLDEGMWTFTNEFFLDTSRNTASQRIVERQSVMFFGGLVRDCGTAICHFFLKGLLDT